MKVNFLYLKAHCDVQGKIFLIVLHDGVWVKEKMDPVKKICSSNSRQVLLLNLLYTT